MRTLNKNKRTLYCALYRESEPIYKLDENGNRIVAFIDDSTDPPTTYYEEIGQDKDGYYKPIKFFGNIVFSGGETNTVEYGISTERYEATLVTNRGQVPITETSLVWFETEPIVDERGYALPESADYTVVKVNHSLNSDRYILSKVVK